MRLKEIEINGFKSFGKKSTLSFTAPVTAIVGPNGSGKSNVVESFRFVLGEQSIKSMRGKSGADLIFKGAVSGSKLSRASVAITFDNSDKVFSFHTGDTGSATPVLFETVTFMRELFSDGTSRYTFNGTEIRLKQMAELLSSVNIGASSHHIISQGEADGILRANSKERREMFEDALGLKIYHHRIKDSEQKLAKALDALKEVQSLRRELAPHLSFLKKQVEKAEKGKALRDELATAWKAFLIADRAQLKKEDIRITEAIEVMTRQKLQKQHELDQLPEITSSQHDEVMQEIRQTKQIIEQISEKRRAIEQRMHRLEGMIEVQRRMVQQRPSSTVSESAGNQTVSFSLQEYDTLLQNITTFIAELRSSQSVAATIETLERFEHIVSTLKHKQRHVQQQAQQQQQQTKHEHSSQQNEQALYDTVIELESLQKELQVLVNDATHHQSLLQQKEIEREKHFSTTQEATSLRYELKAHIGQCDAELSVLAIAKKSFMDRKTLFEQEVQEATMMFGVHFLRSIEQEDGSGDTTVSPPDKRTIDRLKIRVDEHAGIGTEVIGEYEQTQERDAFLLRESTDIETSIRNLESVIVELKKILDEKFTKGIQIINERFGEFFKSMFGGGSAFLSVTIERKKKKIATGELEEEYTDDEENDDRFFQRGIEIHVSLPEKKVKELHMLSGGERSLVSIALLFAISQVNPPPFLVLDETDAALDESNSRKYGDMIERLAAYSQLIVVTHNRETMSRAQVLYGVTLGADTASKLLSIKFDDAVKVAK